MVDGDNIDATSDPTEIDVMDIPAMKTEVERKVKELLVDFEEKSGLKVDWLRISRPNSDDWDLPYDEMIAGPITEVNFTAELREMKRLEAKKIEFQKRQAFENSGQLKHADEHKFR